jgi:hypothetical protein
MRRSSDAADASAMDDRFHAVAGGPRRKDSIMASLLPTRWSVFQRVPTLADVPAAGDDDLAIGWESACPALQLEGWEPAPHSNSVLDPSLN